MDEKPLHERFDEHRIRDEWFEPAEEIATLARSAGEMEKIVIDTSAEDEVMKYDAYLKYQMTINCDGLFRLARARARPISIFLALASG